MTKTESPVWRIKKAMGLEDNIEVLRKGLAQLEEESRQWEKTSVLAIKTWLDGQDLKNPVIA